MNTFKDRAIASIKAELTRTPEIVKSVIFNPVDFFKNMPVEGGYFSPIVFTVAMGIINALIAFIIFLVNAPSLSLFIKISSLFLGPIIGIITLGFGAAVIFGIWKLLGASVNYETTFRCLAYSASSIAPITTLLRLIPYVGVSLKLIWLGALIIIASIIVAGIHSRKALITFGTITALMCILSMGADYTRRNMKPVQSIGAVSRDHLQIARIHLNAPEKEDATS